MSEPTAGPPAGEQLLTVEVSTVDGAVMVAARGEVDTLTALRLGAALDGALRCAAARRVVVDLLGVTFMGSAGLAALAQAARRAEARREPLRVVVADHRPVLRPIQMTDLADLLTLCHDLGEALTS